MSKIIIVSEVFFPDRTTTAHILTKIASRLAQTREVTVICGPVGYEYGIGIDAEDLPGVKIIRLPTARYDKNNLINRTWQFIRLSSALNSVMLKELRSGDEVLIVTNPAPLLILTARAARRHKFPLTILVHDVFPENCIPARVFKSENLVYRLIRKIFNRAYRRASRLIVLGRDMAEIMRKKVGREGPEITIIENWCDSPHYPVECEQNGNINLLYAGNMGRVQGLEEFIELFRTLKNNVKLILRGNGAALNGIKAQIADMPNVCYLGPYSKDEQFEVLADCDLALVTLAKGMYGLGVPSKTYNILRAGKPILYVGDSMSEIALMIKEYNIGFCFEPDNPDGIKAFLNGLSADMRSQLREMGAKAKELALTIYSEDRILSKYQNIFKR